MSNTCPGEDCKGKPVEEKGCNRVADLENKASNLQKKLEKLQKENQCGKSKILTMYNCTVESHRLEH